MASLRTVNPQKAEHLTQEQRTALERHVDFFDTNKNGQLSVKEVRKGLERLGMESWTERVFASTLNNALLGPPTRDRLMYEQIARVARGDRSRHLPCTAGAHSGVILAGGAVPPSENSSGMM